MIRTALSSVLVVAVVVVAAFAVEPAPYGHPDFYPTPQRPVGFRGDGSGAWPGATPAAEWDAAAGRNIVWKAPMPGPSFAQPIVVGEKVFALADPHWLICLDVHTGKVLWQRDVDHTSVMPPDLAAKARQAQKFWDERFREYSIWLDRQRYPDEKRIPQADIDRALKAAEQYTFDINRPGQANFTMVAKKGELEARTMADQAAYSLYNFGHWEGILTHTFATPVSDGKCVYVNMSNDQVACYDLAGDRKWLVWDRPKQIKPGEHHCRYTLSPVLIGERLIVAAAGELRAYDKATGRKLWGVFKDRAFGSYWSKVSSPVPLHLKLAGGAVLEAVLVQGVGIYRAEDGKELLGGIGLPGYEGSQPLILGDLLVRKGKPDGGGKVRVGSRIRVVSRDEVTLEELWRHDSKTGDVSEILFGGMVYSPQNGLRMDAQSGQESPMMAGDGGYPSPVLGGKWIIKVASGGYGNKAKGDSGVASAVVIPVDSPQAGQKIRAAFVDQRYDEDLEFRLRWRHRGNANSMSNASPCVQANRLFHRTVGNLWCVGDPRQPFPAPADCPAEAKARN